MPAKKTAGASSKKSPSRPGRSKSSAARASSSRKASGTARRPAKKTVNQKTVVRKKTGANVKKATKAATKAATKKSTPSRNTKASATKKQAAKKATAASQRPAATAKRPAAGSTRAEAARRTKKPGRTAPELVLKKGPRLAPHRKEEVVPTVAAGDLEGLRAKLVGEREQVLKLYENDMRMSLLPDEDVTDDLVDRANSAYSRELHFAISDGERERLGLIDQALERMQQGTFGICAACRRPVPAPRLQAVPWARYCTDCQELAEKGLLRES